MENPDILAFNGSPRASGNTSHLLARFAEGTARNGIGTEVLHPHTINLKPCTGCLRCNVLKSCSIRDDDWSWLSRKILAARVLVFASPVYFHHLPSPLKAVIDRFRSFIHVAVTEEGLEHTPWESWSKEFVLILSMGSSDDRDAAPVVELFRFMTGILGPENRLHTILGTRLAVTRQVVRNREDLAALYEKMQLPPHLVALDHARNEKLLDECEQLGASLSAGLKE